MSNANEFALVLQEREACFLAQYLSKTGSDIATKLEPTHDNSPGWLKVTFELRGSYDLLQVYHAGVMGEKCGYVFSTYAEKFMTKPDNKLPF